MQIREISSIDDQLIGELIQNVLEEHNANVPGTAYFDETLFTLSEVYKQERNIYYVILEDGEIVGGAGIGNLIGETHSLCELQKIYLSKKVRGKGYGQLLIAKCLEFAKKNNYEFCYLETMPQLSKGINLYKKNGFEELEKPIGSTSHHGCTIWMLKKL